MIKFKTTKTEIMRSGCCVIKIPYCHMQHLLRYQDPFAYTCGYDGWHSDVYYIKKYDTYISTGYQPFGNISIDYDRLKKIEDKAFDIYINFDVPFDSQEVSTNSLLFNLVSEIREEWINKERD